MADETGADNASVEAAGNLIAELLSSQTGDATKEQPQAAPAGEERRVAQPEHESPAEDEAVGAQGEDEATVSTVETADDKPDPKQAKRESELEARLKAVEDRTKPSEAANDQPNTELNNTVSRLQASILAEFSDIKTDADLEKLMEDDVNRYNKFVITANKLQRAVKQQQDQQAVQANQWRAGEAKKLPELIPELADPEKGPEVATAIRKFALANGYTADQLQHASARDFALLNKARLYDEQGKTQTKTKEDSQAQLAQAKAKAAKAPPVQKPGAQRSEDGKGDLIQADYKRLQSKGRVDDAASLINRLGIAG